MSNPATQEKIVYFLAVDIERLGDGYEHPILAVGVCLGNSKVGIIENRQWCFQPLPGQKPEQRCMDEFWSKHPTVLNALQSNAKPFLETMRDFLWWWDNTLETYRPRIVSDNPANDLGGLSWYARLAQPSRSFPMRYVQKTGEHLPIDDPTEQFKGLGGRALRKALCTAATSLAPHSHLAVEDAAHLFWQEMLALHFRHLRAGCPGFDSAFLQAYTESPAFADKSLPSVLLTAVHAFVNSAEY
jgi:hypothetical protein